MAIKHTYQKRYANVVAGGRIVRGLRTLFGLKQKFVKKEYTVHHPNCMACARQRREAKAAKRSK